MTITYDSALTSSIQFYFYGSNILVDVPPIRVIATVVNSPVGNIRMDVDMDLTNMYLKAKGHKILRMNAHCIVYVNDAK